MLDQSPLMQIFVRQPSDVTCNIGFKEISPPPGDTPRDYPPRENPPEIIPVECSNILKATLTRISDPKYQ